MEMEDHQYGLADLRQLMSGGTRSHFPPSIPTHHDLFGSTGYRNSLLHPHPHPHPPPPQQHHHHHNPYDLMMMMPRELSEFRSDSAAAAAVVADVSAPSSGCGFEMETGCLGGGDGGTGRWPRQETLTLLEIRSRLDTKFKEANQKGPLWDEVSRIMAEEHNYQRSGKKCREKFENLYKYYKKTKEGKAGRQDGKNYRFFRQLEALYGETSNATSLPDPHFAGESNLRFINPSLAPPTSQETHQSHQKHYSDSLSLSNTSEFETSSSEDNDNDDDDELGSVGVMDNDSTEKRRKKRPGGKSWKGKIKQFIDSQMRKLIDKQEVWLEKLMKTLEQKEKERMVREEEWRRQEVSRIDRERGFWAKERAWIEARDAALMDALQKLTGRELREYNSSPDHALMAAENQNHGENQNEDGSEILNNSTIKGDHYHHHNHRHRHHDNDAWPESEITKLIQLRTAMKSRFRQSGTSSSDQENLWEEIASKMGCLGYERTSLMCKEKWEIIENYQRKIDQGNKKRKENYSKSGSTSSYNIHFQTDSSLYSTTQGGAYCEMKEQSPNSSNNAATGGGGGNTVPDSCFRFLMGEGDQSQSSLWENFGLKLNNGGDQT